MSKRKNPVPLLRDSKDLKQVKKSKINPKMNFLFIIKKEHSKFFSQGDYNPFEVQNLLSIEVVTVKVTQKRSPTIHIYPEEALKRYLEKLFEDDPEDQIEIEEIDRKEKEEEQENQMTREVLKDLKENLIFKLYDSKTTAKAIAETFGINIQDVYNIYYKKEKEFTYPKKDITPKRFIITQEMYDEVEKFMSEQKYTPPTLNIIRTHLITHFNLDNWRISLPTVSKILKRLSFSRKRTKKYIARRNLEITIEKRRIVALELISALKGNMEIIFIDETGFNQSLVPLYGYSKVGEKCWVKTNAKTQNYTVLAAITRTQVLGFQIFKGSVTAEDFGAFISSLLNRYSRILLNPSKYIFFMDNAPIHKAKVLKPFFSNFCIMFNAPYSPFLNPIEEFFGNLKFNFRKKFAQNTLDILQKILKSFQEIENSLLYSFYLHSMTFLKNCLDKKPIS